MTHQLSLKQSQVTYHPLKLSMVNSYPVLQALQIPLTISHLPINALFANKALLVIQVLQIKLLIQGKSNYVSLVTIVQLVLYMKDNILVLVVLTVELQI